MPRYVLLYPADPKTHAAIERALETVKARVVDRASPRAALIEVAEDQVARIAEHAPEATLVAETFYARPPPARVTAISEE